MKANYHTHTPRCRHAEGAEIEYAEQAVAGDLEYLGFSDHSPYIFDGCYDGYYSSMRMYPEETECYAAAVRDVADQYRGSLNVLLGFEMEFYPALFSRTLDFIRGFSPDYLILGQHFIGNERDESYCGRPTEDSRILDRYCGQCIDGIQSGVFSCLAHPDLINYQGSRREYERQMRRICRSSVDCGVPLEINLLGIRQERNYPDPRFWRIAGEEGAEVILGCDSHRPENTLDPASEQIALRMTEQFGLRLRETMILRKP